MASNRAPESLKDVKSGQPDQQLEQLRRVQMSTNHKEKLTRNREKIVQTLKYMEDIVDHLVGTQSIKDEDAQIISSRPTDQDKTRALLDIVPFRSDAAFHSLLQALVETQESLELYQLLKDDSMPTIPLKRSGPPKYGPVKHFCDKLKDFNRDNLVDQPDQRRHYLTTHIPLTLYGKQSFDVESRHGFRELFMPKSRGNPIHPEDLFAKLQDDSDPRTVLMIGAPGVGKTATCLFFLQQFLNSKLWGVTFHFVFLILLKELGCIEQSISFQDVIFNCFGLPPDNQSDRDRVWKYLKLHQREVLFIIDGLDEVTGLFQLNTPQNIFMRVHDPLFKTQPQTLIHNLIVGNLFKRAKILMSGRPHVAGALQQNVHRTVELLGLTLSDFAKMTMNEFKDKPHLVTELFYYIETNPEIMSMCTTPINARSLLNHIKWCHSEDDHELHQDKLPTSKAALLYFLILNLLRNHHHRLKDDPSLSHEDIVKECKGLIRKLADLAYNSLFRQQQQLFDARDLKKYNLSVHEVIASGLMSGHPSWVKTAFWGVKKYFIEFPHLTIQEYFGALRLAQLPAAELETIILEQQGEKDMILSLCLGAMTDPTCQELLTTLYPHHTQDLNIEKVQGMLRAIWSVPRSLKKDGALFSLSVLRESGLYSMADELSHKLGNVFKSLNLGLANVSTRDCGSIVKLLQHQSEPFYEVLLGGKIERQSVLSIMKAGSSRVLTIITLFTPETLKEVAHVLSDNCALQILTLMNMSVQVDWGEFRVTDNASLQCLRLGGALDTSHMEALCDTLASLHSLQALTLWDGTLSPLTLPRLPAGLRYLTLGDCGLVGKDMRVVTDAVLSSQLVWLDVSGNKISDEGSATLAQCLQDTHNVLEGLVLESCEISSQGVGLLCEAMKCNSDLRVLYLNENNIGDDVDPIVAVLNDSVLEELYLISCGISSAGGCKIVHNLPQNTRLTVLELSVNALGSTEFPTCVKDVLNHNKRLLKLSVYRCGLTDDMLHLIVSGLKQNSTLELLNIGGNLSLTSSSIVRLLADTQLQHLCMHECELGARGWGEVGRAITHSPSLVSSMVGDEGKASDLDGFVEEMAAYPHTGPLQRLFVWTERMGEVVPQVYILRKSAASYTVIVTRDAGSLYETSGLFLQHVPQQIRMWLHPIYLSTQ